MILAAALVLAGLQPALPQTLVNPGFEGSASDDREFGSHVPPGWSMRRARGYRVRVASPSEIRPPRRHGSGNWVFMGYFARNGPDRGSWTGITQTIDARRWRGRRVRVSIAANPAHFAANRAWLEVEAGSVRGRRGFDQVEQWQRYAVDITVPRDAATLTVTIGTNGDVSVDDVRIEPAPR
jgi:hypothetical protein